MKLLKMMVRRPFATFAARRCGTTVLVAASTVGLAAPALGQAPAAPDSGTVAAVDSVKAAPDSVDAAHPDTVTTAPPDSVDATVSEGVDAREDSDATLVKTPVSGSPGPDWETVVGTRNPQEPTPGVLTVPVGNSEVVTKPGLNQVSIGDPEIADAVVVSSSEVVVNGKTPGTTTLLVWDAAGSRSRYRVRIVADAREVEEQVRALFPGERIEARAVGNTVVLHGTARDPRVARRAVELARSLGEAVTVVDEIQVPKPSQVLLRVRFAEVNRSALKELGINVLRVDPTNVRGDDEGSLQAGGVGGTGGSFLGADGPEQSFSDAVNLFLFHDASNVSAFIRALQNEGLLRTLAEPNLLVMSGDSASFLAGGEFPFPVVQGGAALSSVTIQFKEFGIRLRFAPVITPTGSIRLRVAPEVSTLDFANGLQVSGFQVPALLSRRAETSIELEDGQTFAIAGLLDNSLSKNVSKLPILGDIPILGALFRSEEVRQNRSELLVLVTPELVQPLDQPPPLPTGEPETWDWSGYMRPDEAAPSSEQEPPSSHEETPRPEQSPSSPDPVPGTETETESGGTYPGDEPIVRKGAPDDRTGR